MKEIANFQAINAVPNPRIQVVNSYHTTVDKVSKQPYLMVLNVALDKNKANSKCCEFPVYLPALSNYNKAEHKKMLALFQSGAPWVPVECKVFVLYREPDGDSFKYYGFANSFTVVDYEKVVEDESYER